MEYLFLFSVLLIIVVLSYLYIRYQWVIETRDRLFLYEPDNFARLVPFHTMMYDLFVWKVEKFYVR